MNDYNFGNFLCMLRVKNGMTQADIANKLGVTPAAVSKWENGSSKPRVEVLFQLAQLLGVRTEELMCGHYIEDETLDPEAVKRINDRYAYLMRVDAYNAAGVKWRRLVAWIIDWNIVGFGVMLLIAILSGISNGMSQTDSGPPAIGLLFVILLYPVCFVLRDLIFGGRSLGKRIMGLLVLDRQTGMEAKGLKCALRNIFLFILHIDAIVMLVIGKTLGDCAAHTVVVHKKALEEGERVPEITEINQYAEPKKGSVSKVILTVAAVFVGFVAIVVSVTLISLSAARNTEVYKVAYDYFIESQTFQNLGVDESKIWHNRYSGAARVDPDGGGVTQTVEIGFVVKGKAYLVVCHGQNDLWFVCEECTGFH